MRILMLSDMYPPVIGGLERHVQTLSRELIARGHEVAVATLAHEGSPAFEVDPSGVRIYRVAGWNRLLKPFYESAERQFHPTAPDPGVMAGLRKVMKQEQPDIVHGRGWILYSFLPLRPKYSAKLIVTVHDYSLVCPKKNYMYQGHLCDGPAYGKCVRCATEQYGPAKSLLLCSGMQISKRMHGRVDHYVGVSSAVRAANLQAAGKPPRPFDVISTFIPDRVLEAPPRAERPAFLPPEDGYVLFVGELSPHKGVPELLEAYHGFADLAPLVLIGTEHGKAPLAIPAGVTVARNVAHDDVIAAWDRCAVGVVPSTWPEPLPQVAIEAMARGKPVVATAVGGMADAVLDGETGLLVPPGDAPALSTAVRELLLDPARRATMGAAGHQRARQFTVGVVADRIERLYAEVLRGDAPQTPTTSDASVTAHVTEALAERPAD